MGLLRLVFFGFIVLSIIYGAIWLYSKSVRREKLEDAWDEDHPDSDDDAARRAFVKQGMDEYHAGIRPKLILLVYVIPTLVVITVLVLTNWN